MSFTKLRSLSLSTIVCAMSSITLVAGLQFTVMPSLVQEMAAYTFGDFVEKYERTYMRGSKEWSMREKVFKARQKDVIEFHSTPRSWSMGITRFMDYTDQEYQSMLGYKGLGSRASSAGQNLLGIPDGEGEPPAEFAVALGNISSVVRDQGSCGSCWAESAAATLEGHMEQDKTLMAKLAVLQHEMYAGIHPDIIAVSSQTIVSCTENPHHCGGTGGCSGATVELAFDMVKAKGLPLSASFPYLSGDGKSGKCSDKNFAHPVLGITGFEVLPSNAFTPLMRALYSTGGPIAVSVDATHWIYYNGGVFTDLDFGHGDFTVNHAVTLVAYKRPSKNMDGYWKIKNSWGSSWGEQGFIRLQMKNDEANHCGIDYDTHQGTGCDGDPDTAKVCGTCGILYDSVYPVGLFYMGDH